MQRPPIFWLYRDHLRDLVTRTSRAMETAGVDRVVVHSGTALRKTQFDDQFWSLRPTPHFQHWIPLREPGCLLLLAPGKKPKLVWPMIENYWERTRTPEFESYFALFDLVRPTTEAKVKSLVRSFVGSSRAAFIGDDVEAGNQLGFGKSAMNPSKLLAALDALRVHKSEYEVACLQEANVIAARGHAAVKRAFAKASKTELDLHLLYLQATAQDDPETPYKNIVALGENGATLHHIDYKKETDESDHTLLLDAGATYRGYCSDITRTWVKEGANGKQTGSRAARSVFAGLVEGVENLQRALCESVIIGKRYEELHEESHRRVSQLLVETSVISKLSSEAVDVSGISRLFYPHGLGHSLGLQCHDVGCALRRPKKENPYLRNTSTIEAGQAFTIEPGIYFIESLMTKLRTHKYRANINHRLIEELRPFGGIRIEDDIVVRTNGITNLTRDLLPLVGGIV